MRWRLPFLLLLLAGVIRLPAAEPTPATVAWDHVTVGTMKTSIYVGSVTLTPAPLVRQGGTLSARYEVKVSPWFFWGETGTITFTVPEADLSKLAKGETVEFTGAATNHKKKTRQVSGRAQPTDATTGKIKVRITADGYTLIFNSTYQLHQGAPTAVEGEKK
jgi:hypothetical protein